MKIIKSILNVLLVFMIMSCTQKQETLKVEVYETSAGGNKLTLVTALTTSDNVSTIVLNPEKKFQTITGFGGAFTESSAYLLNKLSKENRAKIIEAYFGESGAAYS